MYIKRRYGFFMTLNWSKKPLVIGLGYAAIVTTAYFLANEHHGINISLPWQPISVLGIAVAFYLGFKNNAAYDRTWEARKIWGSIVNNSRSFGTAISSFTEGSNRETVVEEIIYRHIAWLTALRYQLRLQREWEHTEDRLHGIYIPTVCEQYLDQLDAELIHLLNKDELQQYKLTTNMAAQIMHKQSMRLQALKNEGYFDDFRHMALFRLIENFYEDQGKSERIKNFPFPRQYASVAYWMTIIFTLVIPFGLLSIFSHENANAFWITIPFSGLLIWIFFLMEMIGAYTENPFEGTYNDVPITSIARNIEIDLREIIGDGAVPTPIPSENGFLM
jgi:putative membrane protein